MDDKEIRINVETSANTQPIEDYKAAYDSLLIELEAAREKLLELAATPDASTESREAAATAVTKLEEAVKKADAQVKKSTTETNKNERANDAATGAVNDHAAALDRAKQAGEEGLVTLKDLTEFLEKKEEAEIDAAKAERASADSAELVSNRRANQAQVLSTVGDRLGEISARLKTAATEISGFDKELGRSLQTVSELGSTASSVVSGAAAGFAAGGPIGAAVGGLTGVIGSLFTTWTDGQKMVAEADAKAKTALNGYLDTLRETNNERGRESITRYQANLDGQLETLTRITSELENQASIERIRAQGQQTRASLGRDLDRAQISRDVENEDLTIDQGRALNLQIDIEAETEAFQLRLDLLQEGVDVERQKVETARAALLLLEQQKAVEQQKLAASETELDRLGTKAAAAGEVIRSGATGSIRQLAIEAVGDFEEETGRNEQIREGIDDISGDIPAARAALNAAVIAKRQTIQQFEAQSDEIRQTFDLVREGQQARVDEFKGTAEAALLSPISEGLKDAASQFEAAGSAATAELNKVAEIGAGIAGQFEGLAAAAESDVAEGIQRGTQDLFSPIIPKIDQEIAAAGVELSAQGVAARSRLQKLASDAIDDNLQRDEFVVQLEKLQTAANLKTGQLIALVEGTLRVTQTQAAQIRNLEEQLKTR